jgi:hypothetical protein
MVTTTVLSTEMNALATNTLSAVGPVFDLTAPGRAQYCDFELHLASLTPTAGGYVALYAALAVDSATYGDAFREYAQQLVCIFNLNTSASVKHTSARAILMPPELMKFYVDNQAGASLGATLNTVKIVTYTT